MNRRKKSTCDRRAWSSWSRYFKRQPRNGAHRIKCALKDKRTNFSVLADIPDVGGQGLEESGACEKPPRKLSEGSLSASALDL